MRRSFAPLLVVVLLACSRRTSEDRVRADPPPPSATTSASTPPSTSVTAKTWNGPPPKWSKGPNDTYRCTRYLPDSHAAGEALTIDLPQEKAVDFTLKAEAPDKGPVAYEVVDAPVGSTFDATTARFRWHLKAKASDHFLVTFVATANDGRAEWKVSVNVVDDDRDLAWKADIGGPKWPDCAGVAAHAEDSFVVDDFDGDHQLDVAGVSATRASVHLSRDGWAESWGDDVAGEFEEHHGEDGKPVLDFVPAPPVGPMMGMEFDFSGGKVEARGVAFAE
jgi:hypothetical protein